MIFSNKRAAKRILKLINLNNVLPVPLQNMLQEFHVFVLLFQYKRHLFKATKIAIHSVL